ncbi:TetR/AcrR family transcriptional regulator [Smaragdicoccus niigatensis]|uniref:TetR/AcrR family transcriptional regulator n=1 Tax=Smaragdicoccus niigatensis TaxID=359359 RepID=UPI000378149A|nr:TetR/AcrR family transcriptional regulator [Smaragdicoccus niigatensis]
MTRTRLTAEERRRQLVDVGASLFAVKPYDDVSMEDIAERGQISRALLYRHFPTKRDLFAAIYRQAADGLLAKTELDTSTPLAEQIAAGLEAHIDYFAANRNTVLAANRTLAGDPIIQSIIEGELDELRRRLIDVSGVDAEHRQMLSSVVMSWLVFVRVLTVEWLTDDAFSRAQLRDASLGALLGALEMAKVL